MPSVCPKPCSRLATAAVFISIGVVQLLAGVILLRSRYAELLSGPNFMTASSNIGIGCVFGLASSVWKDNRKKHSRKLIARNNVLASLLVTVIVANLISATILVMGDGNKLLYLYMETNRKHISATFANEVLAGAYITSVCSPIVCIVVAIVSLSGNCFQVYSKRKILKSDISDYGSPFEWVYGPKVRARQSLATDYIETPINSLDRSRFSEDSVFSENRPMSYQQKLGRQIAESPASSYIHKREQILRNMALSKRSKLFVSHQDSDTRNISQTEDSHVNEQHQNCGEGVSTSKSSIFSTGKKRKNTLDSTITETGFRDDGGGRNYPIPKQRGETCSSCNSKFSNSFHEKYVNKVGPQDVAGFDECLEKRSRQQLGSPLKTSSSIHTCDANAKVSTQIIENPIENVILMKLQMATMKELKARMQKMSPGEQASLENKSGGTLTSIVKSSESVLGPPDYKTNKNSPVKVFSFKEDNYSDISENVENRNIKDPGNGSTQTSCEQLKTENAMRQASLVTTASRCKSLQYNNPIKGTKQAESIKSKALGNPLVKVKSLDEGTPPEATFTQLANNEGGKKFKNLILDCPEVPSIKMKNRKRDVALRMSSMSSITESPSEEVINEPHLNRTTGSVSNIANSSFSENPECTVNKDENSNITDVPFMKDISTDHTNVRKLRSNSSLKKILKRMRSTASPETKLNLSELIVDEDSLIGLTEKELIARTLRIRALSKAVEERDRK